jgi:hypothetical protein
MGSSYAMDQVCSESLLSNGKLKNNASKSTSAIYKGISGSTYLPI